MKKKGFTQHHFWSKSGAGLTLIEILVVLFIMGFIAISLYYVLNAGMKSWRTGKERTDIIAQARVAMDRLTREAREATYIASTETGSIKFSAYLGTTTLSDISYYYDSVDDILYRNFSSGGTVQADAQKEMAKYMDSFALYYYSKDAGGVYKFSSPPSDQTARNSIWMIEIKSKVKRGLSGEEAEVDLRSTIQPRNYPYPQ